MLEWGANVIAVGEIISRQCWFRDAVCHYYRKKDHIVRICRARLNMKGMKNAPMSRGNKAHCINEEPLYYMLRKQTPPLLVTIKTSNELCEMEVDTGSGHKQGNITQNLKEQSDPGPLRCSNLNVHGRNSECFRSCHFYCSI